MSVRIPVFDRGQIVAQAIVDDEFAYLAQWRWTLSEWGYASRSAYRPIGRRYQCFMHRLILGLERGDSRVTDHINHDKLDNRRENLRAVTNQQNQQNRAGARVGTASGLRGVCKSAGGKWRAYCGNKCVGLFATKEEAAHVAAVARAKAGYLGASQTIAAEAGR